MLSLQSFVVFQSPFKGAKSFPSVSPKISQSEANPLLVVGQASQHQNFLQPHHKVLLSSPSPDFSVSPHSDSSASNAVNIPRQNKDPSLRQDSVTPNPNDMFQSLSSSLHTKPIQPSSKRSKWRSQQNISVSGVGNPYPTNNQYLNQPLQSNYPICQPMHPIVNNPLVSASCCLHQHQDLFGNIYYVPQKPALDLGLCRGCRKIYASSPMIQNPSMVGVSSMRNTVAQHPHLT